MKRIEAKRTAKEWEQIFRLWERDNEHAICT